MNERLYMKKQAFTLAEVMITLLVIGVIAALTLPALVGSYRSKMYTAQVKKAYSELANAVQQVMIDENANDEISEVSGGNSDLVGFYTTTASLKTSNSNSGAQYFLSTYFKYKSKGYGTAGVMAGSYTTPSGVSLGTVDNNYYCMGLKSEASICMKFQNNISKVVIDGNGREAPNQSGQDLFVMRINNDGSISDLDENANKCNVSSIGDSTLEKYASGCLAKAMTEGWKIEEAD